MIVSTMWSVALYGEWPWLSMLAPLGFTPSLLAYVRWQRRCLFLTLTDIIIEWGVATTQAVSFPIRDIDMIEARKTLAGKALDYGDIAIFSGPNVQTFEKLHPFTSFMATYQAYRQFLSGWSEPVSRSLPAPSGNRLLGPSWGEPRRERPPAIDAQYRRLEHRVSGAAGGSVDWSTPFRLIVLVVVISIVIALIIGC